MNPDLARLHPYPFEKLSQLMRGAHPPEQLKHIALSIGEPKHASPAFVLESLARHLDRMSVYPTTKGSDHLREVIANWLQQRFTLRTIDAGTQVLPVNGTREALFAFAQAVIDRDPAKNAAGAGNKPLVISPNPFYQIYEGAAFLAGAEPYFVSCTPDNAFKPDYASVPAHIWDRCQLLFVCSPGNPTGAVLSNEEFRVLIELADKHDFVIASDECYSEIYFDEDAPPPGILEACRAMGRDDYARCIAFHSLSKRSNLPGLRSGFVAGDAHVLAKFLQYRTYHGCAMSLPVQEASITAWQDEAHVRRNRDLYREKFRAVVEILAPVMDVTMPDAGFYLWARTPIADDTFARQLFERENVTVLPGRFLSRDSDDTNPGINRIRMALVASVDEAIEAARRIRRFVETLN